jgi:hypothetical protein
MKSLIKKVTLLAAGIIAFWGINLKDSKAFQSAKITQISSNTPLFLQHANDIFQDHSVMNWHYSHSSHGSHYSHGSHTSHYSHQSHYSSRW